MPTMPASWAGGRGAGVLPVHGHAAGDGAAVEVRDDAVEGPAQRRFARAGEPDDEDELALLELEVDVVEDGARGSPRR